MTYLQFPAFPVTPGVKIQAPAKWEYFSINNPGANYTVSGKPVIGKFLGLAITMRKSATAPNNPAGNIRHLHEIAGQAHVASRLDRFFFLQQRDITWLDGLRAFAILLVISRHVFDRPYAQLFGSAEVNQNFSISSLLASYGWSGVHLFFLISGFLVGGGIILSIRKGSFNWKTFLLRRFFRIFLPSAVFLLIIYNVRHLHAPFKGIAHNFLLLTNYTKDPWLAHYWSLCVEEHFYIIAPLLFIALVATLRKASLSQLAWAFFLAGASLSIARLIAPFLLNLPARPYYEESHWQFDFFAIGIALRLRAETLPARPDLVSWRQAISFMLAVTFAFSAIAWMSLSSRENTLLGNMEDPAMLCLVLSLTSILMAGLFWAPRFDKLKMLLSAKWLRILAAISFSTYLVHIPVIEASTAIFSRLHDALGAHPTACYIGMLLAGGGASLLVGLAFFIMVERPILLLRQRLIG